MALASIADLARSVPEWLGPSRSPTFECAFCGQRYDGEREHCVACGFPVVRGS